MTKHAKHAILESRAGIDVSASFARMPFTVPSTITTTGAPSHTPSDWRQHGRGSVGGVAGRPMMTLYPDELNGGMPGLRARTHVRPAHASTSAEVHAMGHVAGSSHMMQSHQAMYNGPIFPTLSPEPAPVARRVPRHRLRSSHSAKTPVQESIDVLVQSLAHDCATLFKKKFKPVCQCQNYMCIRSKSQNPL